MRRLFQLLAIGVKLSDAFLMQVVAGLDAAVPVEGEVERLRQTQRALPAEVVRRMHPVELELELELVGFVKVDAAIDLPARRSCGKRRSSMRHPKERELIPVGRCFSSDTPMPERIQ